MRLFDTRRIWDRPLPHEQQSPRITRSAALLSDTVVLLPPDDAAPTGGDMIATVPLGVLVAMRMGTSALHVNSSSKYDSHGRVIAGIDE